MKPSRDPRLRGDDGGGGASGRLFVAIGPPLSQPGIHFFHRQKWLRRAPVEVGTDRVEACPVRLLLTLDQRQAMLDHGAKRRKPAAVYRRSGEGMSVVGQRYGV